MKKDKWTILFVSMLSVFILGAAGQTAFADEVAVDTAAELQDAVKNAPENRRVTLSGAFPTDLSATIGLAESPYQVEVDGEGKTIQSSAGKQLFSYGGGTGTASSTLTLKNFNLQGLGNNARALSVSG
ncbi:hypothetical protein P7E02_04860 [Enterococcus hulanensis]|uniref:hypothetical protein n=1 Tax=Enterococcus hulanensis TaxID=2559929 RepID=UPI0028902070|nr:hypothetical protein [Enterococcus hulanensis]MDT2659185.1 hypothetical protein [Enterococcus hulanensis]